MLSSFAFSAVALALLLGRGLRHASVESAGLVFGGVGLLWLPFMLSEQAARQLRLPAGSARTLTFAALWLLPASYACLMLAPDGFRGMGPLLAGGALLLVACGLALKHWARPAGNALPATATAPVVALSLAALCLWAHVEEATLSSINPGSERARSLVFLATWAGSAALAPGLIVRSLDRQGVALSPALRGLAGLTCGAAGLGALVLDARALPGHYPSFHAWLQLVALLGLEGACSLAANACARHLPGRVWPALGAVNLGLIGCAAAAFSLFSVASKPDPGLRSRMAQSPIAGLLFRLQPEATRGLLPRTDDHALLHVPLHHDVRMQDQRFNLLLVTVDALRADALELAPVLSRLAREGAAFDHTYTPGTRTAIALSSLLTGRYSAHLNWELWTSDAGGMRRARELSQAERDRLGPDTGYTTFPDFSRVTGVAERLRRAGLYTLATPYLADKAKWLRRGVGFERGFDDYTEFGAALEGDDSSRQVVHQALEQLGRAGSRRFFQWIHLFDPHRSDGSPARYGSLVASTDAALGELFSGLAQLGLAEQTVILVTGDHGEGFGPEHPPFHATSLYDDQARVPMLLRVPGLPPRRYSFPSSSLDGIATLLALANADLSDIDGMNLLPWLLDSRAAPDRPIFSELHRYAEGPRSHDLKAVRLGPSKLIWDRRLGRLQLFDLERDPYERHDRTELEPERLARLSAVLAAFIHRGERAYPLP